MNYLHDDKGNKSSNRLVFVIGMAAAIIIPTVMTIMFNWKAAEFIGSFTAMASVFATMKVTQKSVEK